MLYICVGHVRITFKLITKTSSVDKEKVQKVCEILSHENAETTDKPPFNLVGTLYICLIKKGSPVRNMQLISVRT